MVRRSSRIFRSGASLLLGALLLVPMTQQKGCDKGAPAKSTAPPTGEFDAAAAERTVRRQVEDLRVALESKQVTGVMRTIDTAGISGYTAFEDQISSLLDSTTELGLFFRSANVQVKPAEGPDKPARAQAIVDAEMVYSLKAGPTQQKRKTGQLQMDLVQGEMGWRFVKIEPRSFFTP
jgi:hypothetical protein